jgi:two-component system, cell cycle response regulator
MHMRRKHLIELPAATDASSDGSTLTPNPQAPWRCRVLLVEDEDGTRARLAAQLTLAGYEVETATSTEEAVRAQGNTACQIVITAWRMPSIDGPALCRSLRTMDTGAYVYCIILAPCVTKSDTLTGLSAGADDFIPENAALEEILARINVGRRIMHHENYLSANLEESRRLSVTDALTGSYNRRYLMKNLPFEIARSRRYHHPLAILCCDLDLFKRVNDRFGHEAGDDVLRQFVSRSRDCLRESVDWIARSGGEEFVVVMPETGLGGAACVADKLRRALSDDPVATCAGRLSVTVSVGATALETTVELNDASVVEILRAADRCLYISKRLGRDRVTALRASYAIALSLDNFGGNQHELN